MTSVIEVSHRLLRMVPAHDREQLAMAWTKVDLRNGDVLLHAHEQISHCHFIVSGILSLQGVLSTGEPAETGMIGSEGLIGLPALLGSDHANSDAVVLVDGVGLRVRADVLKRAFEGNDAIRSAILLFVQAISAQTAQIAVCNSRHDTLQRLARWLLMLDVLRGGGGPIYLTQERLAEILGVRRQQVSFAAAALHDLGSIACRRGSIEVIDIAGLKSVACECFATIAEEYKVLLGA